MSALGQKRTFISVKDRHYRPTLYPAGGGIRTLLVASQTPETSTQGGLYEDHAMGGLKFNGIFTFAAGVAYWNSTPVRVCFAVLWEPCSVLPEKMTNSPSVMRG